MYAIFEAKGKQFRATPDQRIRMPSLGAEPGDRVTFDTVLLAQKGAGEDVLIGRPSLEGASVAVEVLRHGKEDKIVVFKMKRRKGYRRKQGHRQKFTEVKVVDIDFGTGESVEPGTAEKKATAKAEKPKVRKKPETKQAQPPVEPEAVDVVDAAKAATAEVEATDAAAELAAEADIDLADIEGTGEDGRVLKGDVEQAIEAAEAAEIDATPTARELAEEEGIDLAALEGTGKNGRILKSDVEAAIKARDEGE